MTDAELRLMIQDEVRRVEDHLSAKLDLAVRDVRSHMTDRFAHGWDHEQIKQGQEVLKDWQAWRDAVNKWRYGISGGLATVVILVPVLTAVFVDIINK